MAEEGGIDDADVSHSRAFQFLAELHTDGKLTQAQVEYFRSKYAKLHEAVLQTYENEKNLLKSAKSLNLDLVEDRKRLEDLQTDEKTYQDAIADCQAERGKADAEVALCEERDAMMQLEIAELQRQEIDIRQEKEDKEREVADALAPRLASLELAGLELRGEISRVKEQSTRLGEEKFALDSLFSSLNTQVKSLRSQSEDFTAQHIKLKNDGPKFKKQASLVEISVKTLEGELSTISASIAALDAKLADQSNKRKTFDESRADLALQFERYRTSTDQKERIAEEIKRNLELEREEAAVAREERARLDREMKALQTEHKMVIDELSSRQKEKEACIKKFKKLEIAQQAAKDSIPEIVFQREDLTRVLGQSKLDKKKQLMMLEELNRDVDLFINSFLQEESLEKSKAVELAALIKENKELDAQLGELAAASHTLSRQIFELSVRRDAKAREFAKACNSIKQTEKEVKVKEIVILDVSKRAAERQQQVAEFVKLHDIVKNERNKYMNLIQTSEQSMAEMQEKLGILQNEIDILHHESLSKNTTLDKERSETQLVTAQRDSARADANRVLCQRREKQEVVDQQIAEIDKLNSVISLVEKEMVRVKKMYEVAVEERNYTGIQLIDRNDELCILYEKSNIQEQIMRNGEYEFLQRQNEVRVLKIELAQLQWKVDVTRRVLPEIPQMEEAIARLKKEIAAERRRNAKLSFDLENPSNASRWRLLAGKDLDKDELALKFAEIEERLSAKKDMLDEKELVLSETSQLIDVLRGQATEGREETINTAKIVNDIQARIKAVTRKMIACVSELALYQATSKKLEVDCHMCSEALAEARHRLESGDAPTDDAEREWRRQLRVVEMRDIVANAKAEEQRINALMAAETHAEVRPTAYIPDDNIGLPKPYSFAPFKPSDAGSSMRHVVKPRPREIQI